MPGLLEKDQVGKKEDLADLISVADAKGTPFTTMIKKGKKPTNTLMRWQADAELDPDTDGVVDGADVDSYENMAEKRAELKNRVQNVRKAPKVSKLAEDVSDVAGLKKKEMAAAKAKAVRGVKRSIEAVFLSDNEVQEDTGAVPNKTRGLGKWLQSTAQDVYPVASDYLAPSDSINSTVTGSLTEALFNAVLQSMYEQTGIRKRLVLFCGTALKAAITDFTKVQPGVSSTIAAIRTYNQDGAGKTIHATVDFYDGDFAEVEMVPALFLAWGNAEAVRNARGYVVDPEDIALRFNQMPTVRELEDKGGGPRALVEAIVGLQVGNPLKHGKFAATS